MRRFKSATHAQRFLSVHGPVQNLFRLGRHLLKATHHRLLRARSFRVWDEVTSAHSARAMSASEEETRPKFANLTVPTELQVGVERRDPVRLEFPILSLNPRLRQGCVAPDVWPTLSRA